MAGSPFGSPTDGDIKAMVKEEIEKRLEKLRLEEDLAQLSSGNLQRFVLSAIELATHRRTVQTLRKEPIAANANSVYLERLGEACSKFDRAYDDWVNNNE